MTNSNWKPVPHHPLCNALGFNDKAEQVFQPKRICTCKEGTRWHGYGERVGDFAAVWALTGWLAQLSAPVQPAAVPPDILKQATAYAHDIVTWLHRDHYSDNTTFEPFDDLLGLLSQIDNMICGWKDHAAQPVAVPDEVMRALDRMCTPLDDSWLGSKSATAQEDARCMKVIRDYVLGSAVKVSLTTGSAWSDGDLIEKIEEYGGERENEGGAYAMFQKSEARRYRAQADEVLAEIRALLATRQPSAQAEDGGRDAYNWIERLEHMPSFVLDEHDCSDLVRVIAAMLAASKGGK